jgi:hypothetical protein
MDRDCFWLTDRQFAKIAPHLPTDTRGKARVDDRRVISGIFHVLKSGGRWVDAPSVYGPRKTLSRAASEKARRLRSDLGRDPDLRSGISAGLSDGIREAGHDGGRWREWPGSGLSRVKKLRRLVDARDHLPAFRSWP